MGIWLSTWASGFRQGHLAVRLTWASSGCPTWASGSRPASGCRGRGGRRGNMYNPKAMAHSMIPRPWSPYSVVFFILCSTTSASRYLKYFRSSQHTGYPLGCVVSIRNAWPSDAHFLPFKMRLLRSKYGRNALRIMLLALMMCPSFRLMKVLMNAATSANLS